MQPPYLHSLPVEIVSDIIELASSLEIDHQHGCGYNPVPFTHVDSRLREIVTGFSKLWTHISYAKGGSLPNLDRLQTFLERSGDALLRINIDLGECDDEDQLWRIRGMIGPYLRKAQSLGLRSSIHAFMGPPSTWTTTTRCEHPVYLCHGSGIASLPSGIISSPLPELREINLTVSSDEDIAFLLNLDASLSSITLDFDLEIEGGIMRSESIHMINDMVLKHMSSLETLDLSLAPQIRTDEDEMLARPQQFPHLHTIKIRGPTLQVLRYIEAPVLHKLKCHIDKDMDIDELASNNFSTLTNFMFAHSTSLGSMTFNDSLMQSSELEVASSALPLATRFPRLHSLKWDIPNSDGHEHILNLIEPCALKKLTLRFDHRNAMTWTSALHLIHRHSSSLESINLSQVWTGDEGRSSFGNGPFPLLTLPRLKKIECTVAGNGILLASIESAPLLSTIELQSPAADPPSQVSFYKLGLNVAASLTTFLQGAPPDIEIPNGVRTFPALRTLHVQNGLEILDRIEAPVLSDLKISTPDPLTPRGMDRWEESDHNEASRIVLRFMRRHAGSITRLLGPSLPGLINGEETWSFHAPYPPLMVPTRHIPDIGELISFPALETLVIRQDDGLLPYIQSAPRLKRLSVCSSHPHTNGTLPAEFVPVFSLFASVQTLDIVNPPNAMVWDSLLQLCTAATGLEKVVVTKTQSYRRYPAEDTRVPRMQDISHDLLSTLASLAIAPPLRHLDILVSGGGRRDAFYSALKKIVSPVEPLAPTIAKIILRAADSEIQAWVNSHLATIPDLKVRVEV